MSVQLKGGLGGVNSEERREFGPVSVLLAAIVFAIVGFFAKGVILENEDTGERSKAPFQPLAWAIRKAREFFRKNKRSDPTRELALAVALSALDEEYKGKIKGDPKDIGEIPMSPGEGRDLLEDLGIRVSNKSSYKAEWQDLVKSSKKAAKASGAFEEEEEANVASVAKAVLGEGTVKKFKDMAKAFMTSLEEPEPALATAGAPAPAPEKAGKKGKK